ncbi:MAG: hypothetical protein M3461_13145 [Pseudomonadota bacterium]|nr:hypothetical protein [Pseudomonadota bacterium]
MGDASAPMMARKILDGSGAHRTDTVGAGQAGIAADLREGLLSQAEEARGLLKQAGGSDELVIGLEWLINRLDE